jgi:hypothetical protein
MALFVRKGFGIRLFVRRMGDAPVSHAIGI